VSDEILWQETGFESHPPQDELGIIGRSDDGREATYAWKEAPGEPAGTLRFELQGERIKRLVVTSYPESGKV
jgi:hypothetical protein